MYRKITSALAFTALTFMAGGQASNAQSASFAPPTTAPAVSASDHETSVKFLLSSINGTQPTAADVSCLAKVISPAEIEAVFSMIGKSGGNLDMTVLNPIMKKVYGCKPSILITEVKTRFLSTSGLTPKQQTCAAEAILEVVAADNALINGVGTDSTLKSLKPELKAKIAQAIQPKLKKCVPAKAARTKVTSALTA